MIELLVLGEIPGTNYQLGFTAILGLAAVVALLLLEARIILHRNKDARSSENDA